MDFKVNINRNVKVKLTDFGISILKQQHEELDATIKANGGKGLGEFELKLDSEGYYVTQLWWLMRKFGHVMTTGHVEPFDIDIIVTNGNPV